MNPAIVYIYPAEDGPKHTELALRFIETYNACPPGASHETVVVLNGAKRTTEIECLFGSLPKVKFLEHDDSGWDIGGYQAAARQYPADLMAFFGGSTYFPRPGWLRRMIDAYEKHGEALYGTMANRGDLRYKVYPHIRTTAFWLSSKLFNAYPWKVERSDQRYPFEHGKDCLTGWITNQGLKAWLVTWGGCYAWEQWDIGQRGFYSWNIQDDPFRKNRRMLLVGDRLTT